MKELRLLGFIRDQNRSRRNLMWVNVVLVAIFTMILFMSEMSEGNLMLLIFVLMAPIIFMSAMWTTLRIGFMLEREVESGFIQPYLEGITRDVVVFRYQGRPILYRVKDQEVLEWLAEMLGDRFSDREEGEVVLSGRSVHSIIDDFHKGN